MSTSSTDSKQSGVDSTAATVWYDAEKEEEGMVVEDEDDSDCDWDIGGNDDEEDEEDEEGVVAKKEGSKSIVLQGEWTTQFNTLATK